MRVQGTLQRICAAIASLAVVLPTFAEVAPDAASPPLPLIEPSIIHYRWTFLEPVWTVEPLRVDVRIVDPATRSKRIDFDGVEFRFEHRPVGRVPEFSCKYADFAFPNECRTTWRNLYADVPVAIMRRDHVDIDVPDWHWHDARTIVDVPRLEWKERELIVSVPATADQHNVPPDVSVPTVKEMP